MDYFEVLIVVFLHHPWYLILALLLGTSAGVVGYQYGRKRIGLLLSIYLFFIFICLYSICRCW